MQIKNVSKYIGISVIGILVFFIGVELGYQAKYKLDMFKSARELDAFNKAVLQVFKSDNYGGRTPEQTYNLFVDALKREDTVEAVKYVVLDIERRQRYYDQFNQMKSNNELKVYADKLPEWKEWKKIKDKNNDWVSQATVEHSSYSAEPKTVKLPDGSGGYIEHTWPAGNYIDYSILFTKNINGFWKISSF